MVISCYLNLFWPGALVFVHGQPPRISQEDVRNWPQNGTDRTLRSPISREHLWFWKREMAESGEGKWEAFPICSHIISIRTCQVLSCSLCFFYLGYYIDILMLTNSNLVFAKFNFVLASILTYVVLIFCAAIKLPFEILVNFPCIFVDRCKAHF